MIYTSYFGKLKTLPKNIIPIAICAGIPEWYNGAQYKKLAPTWNIFSNWKKNHNEEEYIKNYYSEVLNKLNVNSVVDELNEVVRNYPIGTDIALICYEKPRDFCHRHLVAAWLEQNGYKIEEYKN